MCIDTIYHVYERRCFFPHAPADVRTGALLFIIRKRKKHCFLFLYREITTLLTVLTQRTNVRTYSVVGDGLHVALHEKLKRGGSLAPVHGFANAMLAR